MNDAIKNFKKRRADRLGKRCDADAEENSGGGKKGGHGNTRLPYGIAKSEGIDTTGMTPNEVWEALGGKGYSAKSAYNALKETKGKGKVTDYMRKSTSTAFKGNKTGNMREGKFKDVQWAMEKPMDTHSQDWKYAPWGEERRKREGLEKETKWSSIADNGKTAEPKPFDKGITFNENKMPVEKRERYRGKDKSGATEVKTEEATIKPGVSVGSTELSFGHSKESQKDAANKLADYIAKDYERELQQLKQEGYEDEYNEMSSFVKDVKAIKDKSVDEAKTYSKELAKKWHGTEYAGKIGRFKALYEIDPEAKPKYGKYADGHRFWIHI